MQLPNFCFVLFFINITYPSKGTLYSTIANTFYSKLHLVIKHGKKCNIFIYNKIIIVNGY